MSMDPQYWKNEKLQHIQYVYEYPKQNLKNFWQTFETTFKIKTSGALAIIYIVQMQFMAFSTGSE